MASGVKIINQAGKISNVLGAEQLKSGKLRNSKTRASGFGFEKVAEKERALPREIASASRGLLDYYNFSKQDEKNIQ